MNPQSKRSRGNAYNDYGDKPMSLSRQHGFVCLLKHRRGKQKFRLEPIVSYGRPPLSVTKKKKIKENTSTDQRKMTRVRWVTRPNRRLDLRIVIKRH